jgi:HEPN domain-containing protein
MDEGKTAYWLDLVEYDLETAQAMLATGRYLYVGFMCHQAVEKGLKAFIAKDGSFPPKTHNLNRLAELGKLDNLMSPEHQTLIDMLLPLNIEARYPSYKDKIHTLLNDDNCKKIVDDTKDLITWIKSKL